MRSYKTQGFVIRRINYTEADRIITLFTSDLGKVVVVAKGVRLMKSRKRGSLEVFSNIKFQAVESSGLDILTEVEEINNYTAIRKSLKKISVGYYMNEIIDRLLAEREPDLKMYKLFTSYMTSLASIDSGLKDLRTNFARDVLVQAGYWPRGRQIEDVDRAIEDIVSRSLFSRRVGKKVLS